MPISNLVLWILSSWLSGWIVTFFVLGILADGLSFHSLRSLIIVNKASMVGPPVIYPFQVINSSFITKNLMFLLNFGIHLILSLFSFFAEFFFLYLPVILSLQPFSLFDNIVSLILFFSVLNLPFFLYHLIKHDLFSFRLLFFLSAFAVWCLQVIHKDIVEDVFSYSFKFAIAALNAGLFNLKIHFFNFIS